MLARNSVLAMASFSPYVTIYDTRKNPPTGELVYRASLNAYLALPHYQLERPEGAVASPSLLKTQLPTAQRAQNREMNNPQVPGLETGKFDPTVPPVDPELVKTNAQKAIEVIEPQVPAKASAPESSTPTKDATDDQQTKPSRSQPRRRAKASESSTSEN